MKLDQVELRSFKLSFLNQDSYLVAFNFSKIPFVTVASESDVNMFVESVTKNGCTIRSSSPITDTVYINVIGYNT